MNFGDLKSLSFAFVPQGKANAVSAGTRASLINLAVADVALRARCLRTSEDFASLTGIAKYNLSDNLTRFLAIDDGGVWFNGVTGGFKYLAPYFLTRIREEFPSFQSDAPATPLRYYLLGDDIYLHPAVTTGAAARIRVYFIQRPIVMTLDAHFPFHKDGDQLTENERLEVLSESILLYVESRILKALGEKEASIAKYAEYLADIKDKVLLINGRSDMA